MVKLIISRGRGGWKLAYARHLLCRSVPPTAPGRAAVKDLIFPGNLQEIMNRVLAAQRMSEAQLIEARTKAETYRIDVAARSDAQRLTSEAEATTRRMAAQSEAEAIRLKTEAEVAALAERAKAAAAYSEHPALLKLEEFEALRDLAKNANARIYIGFDRELKDMR